MKRNTIILLLAIFLVISLVTSEVIVRSSRDVPQDIEIKERLARAGLENYTVGAISCGTEVCEEVCILVEGVVNKCYTPNPYWINHTPQINRTTGDFVINASSGFPNILSSEKIYFNTSELETVRTRFETNVVAKVHTRQEIKEETANATTVQVDEGDRVITQR